MLIANRTIRIAVISLIIGIVFSFRVAELGAPEWSLLGFFAVLGFCAGTVQAVAIAKAREGAISPAARNLRVVLSLAVLVALKIVIAASIITHLQNTGTSLLIQICFSLFGLFLARGLMQPRSSTKSSAF